MNNGEELLALFPPADRQRWILWSPSGYYDCAPEAEDLVGWHIERGPSQAADFYPLSRFRANYYRPDVVKLVLPTQDEERALQLANKVSQRPSSEQLAFISMLPPVVRIISPADGTRITSSDVEIKLAVRSSTGYRITSIRALVDGRPAVQKRPLARITADQEQVHSLRVPIPRHDCEVTVIAENRNGIGRHASVWLVWTGSLPRIQPRLFVLAVGVGEYVADRQELAESDHRARF